MSCLERDMLFESELSSAQYAQRATSWEINPRSGECRHNSLCHTVALRILWRDILRAAYIPLVLVVSGLVCCGYFVLSRSGVIGIPWYILAIGCVIASSVLLHACLKELFRGTGWIVFRCKQNTRVQMRYIRFGTVFKCLSRQCIRAEFGGAISRAYTKVTRATVLLSPRTSCHVVCVVTDGARERAVFFVQCNQLVERENNSICSGDVAGDVPGEDIGPVISWPGAWVHISRRMRMCAGRKQDWVMSVAERRRD